MESKEEQSKKKDFKLADLTADQHAVTTVPKFIKDLAFFYLTTNNKILKKDIQFEGVDPAGHPLRWSVIPNRSPKIGVPGIEAHTIWTRLVRPAMDDELNFKGEIPEILPLGGIRKCLRTIGWVEGGWEARALIQGLMQIGQATCDVDFYLPTGQVDSAGQPLFTQVKAIFNRFTIWKIGSKHLTEDELVSGELKFNFDLDDTLYLQLHKLERQIQSQQGIQYLDNQLMFSLAPSARRWYELMHADFYAVVKNGGPYCEVLYSAYVRHHHTLTRQTTHKRIVEQMNRLVRDLLNSKFIEHVEYRKIQEPGKPVDFVIRYYPGVEANKESIRRVLAWLKVKGRLPTEERWARYPKKKKTNEPIPADHNQSGNDLLTKIVQEVKRRHLLPAPAPRINAELVRAVSERGIAGAAKFLSSVSADRLERAFDCIDYWDGEKSNGKPVGPGLLRKLITGELELPANFETRRERQERQAAAIRRQNCERLQELSFLNYGRQRRQIRDRYIRELPAGEFDRRLEGKKEEEQSRRGPWSISPEVLQTLARNTVIEEIEEELQKSKKILSYQDFYDQELPAILIEMKLEPAECGIELTDDQKSRYTRLKDALSAQNSLPSEVN